MAKTGDSFTVSIGPSQLNWGTYRNPTSRPPIPGEAYIAIPKKYAIDYELYNSNYTQTGLGYNEFLASTADGYIRNEILLAQGSSAAGDPYAKNFAFKGDLKRLGSWFSYCNATTSNKIKITFTSSTSLILELI